ncbi:MAG TPA: hypothetical protein VEQ59_06205 [Polyangiaceae bacterium]|nr:hypothetical protein [Polyangiaceae bacterium]
MSEPELRRAAPQELTAEEVRLGGAVLIAPIAWALHLVLSYGLIYPAERWQSKAVLFVVSLLGGLAALVSLLLGYRKLKRANREGPDATRERSRFLGTCACGLGIFFLLAIVAQTVPSILLPLGFR